MSLATGRGAWHLARCGGFFALVFLSASRRDPRRCLRALQSHGQVRAGARLEISLQQAHKSVSERLSVSFGEALQEDSALPEDCVSEARALPACPFEATQKSPSTEQVTPQPHSENT